MDALLDQSLKPGTAVPRIIHLISSTAFYGAEKMLLEHCRATPGDHLVVLLGAPDELRQRFSEQGVRAQICHGLKELLAVVRANKSPQTLLNTHNFRAQLFGWAAAMLTQLPLIVTQHGFTPRSRKQRLYTWLSLRQCRLPWVRKVVCVANSVAQLHRLAGVAERKLQVIPNGLADISIPAHLEDLHQPRPLLGFVGRFSAEKGPDLFLDTVIPLCQQYPQLHAVMLGDGPEREVLEQRIQQAGLAARITLPGYQHNMLAWLQQLTALIISSRTEGTPMILLEAMQMQTPVVSFAVGGIPDVLTDAQDGLLAPALQCDLLRQQVQRLLDNPALAEQLTQQARHTLATRYYLPALAEQWLQVYRQLLPGAAPC